jgi:hypothetical protein
MRMKVEKDYEELLRLFNKHNVRYCIVGSYALAFYARPRYSKDMDILVEPSTENACRSWRPCRSLDLVPCHCGKRISRNRGRLFSWGTNRSVLILLLRLNVWISRRYGKPSPWAVRSAASPFYRTEGSNNL